MKSFDPTELDWADQYKLVAGSIVPRPIALVTTLGPDGCGSACKKDPVSGVIGV